MTEGCPLPRASPRTGWDSEGDDVTHRLRAIQRAVHMRTKILRTIRLAMLRIAMRSSSKMRSASSSDKLSSNIEQGIVESMR